MPPMNAPMMSFDSSGMRPESVFSFVGFTFAFLLVVWLVDSRTRPLGIKFVIWGVLVEILSVGYGMTGVPALMMVIPSLGKVGFLLVLGGIAASLLTSVPASPASKETEHV